MNFLGLTSEKSQIQKDSFDQNQTVEISICNEIEANACFLLNKKSSL